MPLFSIFSNDRISYLIFSALQGSIECRLLTSVFYDFGKSLSSICPHSLDLDPKTANDYFMAAFQQFIDCFPNLRLNDERVASQKIETGSSKFTFLAYARLHARNGFKHKQKARSKQNGK